MAERFELYIDGVEIANGNTESTDVEVIKNVFQKEKRGIDDEFLKALVTLKGKSFAGVGLGVDRLVMKALGLSNIDLCDSLLDY